MRNHLIYVAIGALALSGCGSSPPDEQSSTASEENQVSVVTIDGGKYSAAAYQGKDEDGKTKEEYLIDLSPGVLVNVTNAPITSKDTSSTPWSFGMGYSSTPHIVCKQEEPEAKKVLLSLTKKIWGATVIGTYTDTYDDVIYLKNCTVESGAEEEAKTDTVQSDEAAPPADSEQTQPENEASESEQY